MEAEFNPYESNDENASVEGEGRAYQAPGEQEYADVAGFKERQQIGEEGGEYLEGLLGRVQIGALTAEQRAEKELSDVLDREPFDRLKGFEKRDVLALVNKVPNFQLRNPTILAAALIWFIRLPEGEKSSLDKKTFKAYTDKLSFSDINQADLLRYIRWLSPSMGKG